MDSVTSPPAHFKDRKGALVLFGIMTVLMGCLSALLVPAMIFAQMIAAKQPNPPPAAPSIVPIAITYGSLAVVLIWLGMGSIMTRRWARALLAIWSWSWLVFGLIAVAIMCVMAPSFFTAMQAAQPPGKTQLSPGAQTAIMLIPLVTMGFIFVVLPLIWGLFYSGKNVKATCEARDPKSRWTDRCPSPVLAVSLWLAFGALSMLGMPAFHAVAPFFGVILSGPTGTAFYLILAVVWAYSAWAIYRLDRRGWWVTVIALILFCLSNLITYSRHDLAEVYAAMGYQSAQITQMRNLGLLNKNWMLWFSLLCTLPFLGYLFYLRKFFAATSRISPEIS